MTELWISKKEMTALGKRLVSGQVMAHPIGHGLRELSGRGHPVGNFHCWQFTGDRASLVSCDCGERFISEQPLKNHQQIVHGPQVTKRRGAGDIPRVPAPRSWKGTPEQEQQHDAWRQACMDLDEACKTAEGVLVEAKAVEAEAKLALARHRREGDPYQESYYAKERALIFASVQGERARAAAEQDRREKKELLDDLFHRGWEQLGKRVGSMQPYEAVGSVRGKRR